MTDTFTYQIKGTAAQGQTWETSGEVVLVQPGKFMELITAAMGASFIDLTKGKAVFGNPGVGCAGPYQITELHVVKKEMFDA